MADEPVALGVELLANVERELSLPEAMDRIETVTTDPVVAREILERAEAEGAIEREGKRVRPRSGSYVSFESQIVVKEGDFECRRCGAGISEGHFIRFDAGEHGPFGSSCIRKVTGRE
jgi:hypothetical protein